MARDDGKKSDGMSLIPSSRGRLLVWNATCVDTLISHVSSTSGWPVRQKASRGGNTHSTATTLRFGVETLGPDAWLLQRRYLIGWYLQRIIIAIRGRVT